jgi:hypothetical protein
MTLDVEGVNSAKLGLLTGVGLAPTAPLERGTPIPCTSPGSTPWRFPAFAVARSTPRRSRRGSSGYRLSVWMAIDLIRPRSLSGSPDSGFPGEPVAYVSGIERPVSRTASRARVDPLREGWCRRRRPRVRAARSTDERTILSDATRGSDKMSDIGVGRCVMYRSSLESPSIQ